MKKSLLSKVLSAILTVTVLTSFAAPVLATETTPDSKQSGVITVQGRGAVSVTPDIAYVEVGLQNTSKTAAQAQADNAKQFAALVKALKAVGVKDDDIKTSNYSVYPSYSYTYDEKTGRSSSAVKEYVCGDTVTITVNNIDDVAKVVYAAGQNGATNISGVRFSVKDTSDAYEKALERAYASSFKSAKAIAKAAGITLNLVPLTVQETSYYSTPVYYGNVKSAAADAVNAESAPTQIYSSDMDVTASVSVTFGY